MEGVLGVGEGPRRPSEHCQGALEQGRTLSEPLKRIGHLMELDGLKGPGSHHNDAAGDRKFAKKKKKVSLRCFFLFFMSRFHTPNIGCAYIRTYY